MVCNNFQCSGEGKEEFHVQWNIVPNTNVLMDMFSSSFHWYRSKPLPRFLILYKFCPCFPQILHRWFTHYARGLSFFLYLSSSGCLSVVYYFLCTIMSFPFLVMEVHDQSINKNSLSLHCCQALYIYDDEHSISCVTSHGQVVFGNMLQHLFA